MRSWLALIVPFLLAGCAHQVSEPVEPLFLGADTYPADFYYGSYAARGSQQCDRGLGQAAERDFQRYFGYRFDRAMAAYVERYGPAPDPIILTICRRWSGSDAAFFREKRELRREFALWLARVEVGIESWSDIP
ncbi:hypothetical protein [Aurantiacibacter sediminis]|uniref:Lipoprotein n=1 Tax=Aurantiacibacter sediminis TaxID=2793064 RepID=A0ABS0N3U2_9SPHN|nr:hypothetical protein [Aurantiacibacter sediminis]MBH5321674.1 hypothetical protein [Aurantiacibacter sediminis]